MRPRRDVRSPTTVPTNSCGTVTSTAMTGSSNAGDARFTASRTAMEPAIWKAMSEESTSWYDPKVSVTFTSTMGYPVTIPLFTAC